MMVSAGSLAARYSPTRAQVYRRLLVDPAHTWTVTELHEALGDADISTHTVRAVVNVLLGERVVEQLRGYRALTVKLTAQGWDVLRVLLESWARLEVAT